MSLREIDFNLRQLWDIRGRFSGVPFAAVDPGEYGAVLAYPEMAGAVGQKIPRAAKLFPMSAGLDTIAEGLIQLGVRMLVVEGQHVNRDISGALKLARRAAYLPAFLAGALAPEDVTVIWLQPASWQSTLKNLHGKRPRLKKGEAKQLALEYAETIYGEDGRWLGATKAQRSGIADTNAIALWAHRAIWMPPRIAKELSR